MKQNIIVTGANGFLGSHLVDFLVNKEYQVFAFIRPGIKVDNLIRFVEKGIDLETKRLKFGEEEILIPTNKENLFILECDIKDGSLINKLIDTIHPFLIFHFAAQPHVIPSWEDPINTIETNVIGTLNVFESLKKHNISSKVIVACSSAEYGTTTKLNRPLKEEDHLKAIHPYGISKIATELLARQYYINFGIEIINLRFFNQTGPRKKDDACSDFIRKIAQIELGLIEPVLEVGNINPYRDITGISDSIQAIWLAALKGKAGETYNVCSSKKIQIKKILDIALSFSKKKINVKTNTPQKLRKTDEDIILGDNSKILRDLGWTLNQSIEDILKEMFDYWIDFYRAKGKN